MCAPGHCELRPRLFSGPQCLGVIYHFHLQVVVFSSIKFSSALFHVCHQFLQKTKAVELVILPVLGSEVVE